VHLAGLYLAGIALAWTGRALTARIRRRVPTLEPVVAGLLVAGVVALSPAWI
jgi:hypothetical protein